MKRNFPVVNLVTETLSQKSSMNEPWFGVRHQGQVYVRETFLVRDQCPGCGESKQSMFFPPEDVVMSHSAPDIHLERVNESRHGSVDHATQVKNKSLFSSFPPHFPLNSCSNLPIAWLHVRKLGNQRDFMLMFISKGKSKSFI